MESIHVSIIQSIVMFVLSFLKSKKNISDKFDSALYPPF